MDKLTEEILKRRMHGLYLSRKCDDIISLAQKLLGMHCWFSRNVVFSALIRGAGLGGWKTALTKTWLYRGTLHGVSENDLRLLLSLHSDDLCEWLLEPKKLDELAKKVISLMEDGVYSRAQMRRIFADELDEQTIERVFSPWGGIFVYLAKKGMVAFRNMTSRDFDLIDAQPFQTQNEVLPEILHRFFESYGPATASDAAWFLGFKDEKPILSALNPNEYDRIEAGRKKYYFIDTKEDIADIPQVTLLSGFDPFIVSYMDRSAVLPKEYRNAVILKSGICLPTIAINGQVAGIWNIKKGRPTIEFFAEPDKRIKDKTYDLVDDMRRKTAGIL